MQKMRSHLAGEHVEVRGEPWIVLRAESYDACTLVTLRGTGDDNRGRTTELIAPFDRILTASRSTRIRRVSRRVALQTAAAAIARAHEWSEPWTAATARMDFLPWQFEPALSAVNGATRLLLADGVGLGKTLQAGLVLTELRARGLVRRALVLTPASLREQWAAELNDRFALDALVLDHAALTRFTAELPPGINPWSIAATAISSIDLVKRGEVRRALDAIPLDLLIVDEAHHLRPGTDRGALVADLAARVPWLVLATATPHAGDEGAYAFLRSLGALGEASDMTTFRRGNEVAKRATRRLVFQPVRATDPERELLNETLAYGRAVWRAHRALVAAVICRRAVSSPAALLRTLTRRRELLASEMADAPVQSELPWQENDERDAVESDEMLASARLSNATAEREWLDRLICLAQASVHHCSKAAVIERLLARGDERLIVFSEYRDTVAFLQERLSPSTTVAVIHGGLSARERRDNTQRFVNGSARVLLATDAAGEGLNLQQRCRLVLNVELPWNPLRLEQRIGRVDRIGQTRRVHAIQLVHRESFEDQVLARFEQRLHSTRRWLFNLHVDEHAVAAAVFDGADVALAGKAEAAPTIAARVGDSPGQRRRAAAFVNGRRIIDSIRQPVCAAAGPRQQLTSRVTALFECDFHDGAGRLVARDAVALVAHLTGPIRLRRGNTRRAAEEIAASSSLRQQLDILIDQRRSVAESQAAGAAAAIQQRLEQILTALDSRRPALLQGSLFDRRAEQQARAADASVSQIRVHIQRRVDSVLALRRVHGSAPRLIAIWPF